MDPYQYDEVVDHLEIATKKANRFFDYIEMRYKLENGVDLSDDAGNASKSWFVSTTRDERNKITSDFFDTVKSEWLFRADGTVVYNYGNAPSPSIQEPPGRRMVGVLQSLLSRRVMKEYFEGQISDWREDYFAEEDRLGYPLPAVKAVGLYSQLCLSIAGGGLTMIREAVISKIPDIGGGD